MTVPSRRVLTLLSAGCANHGYAATPGYLHQVARMVTQTRGPVLECGSGISTIVLGLMIRSSGRRIVSLESNPRWGAHMRDMLKRLDLQDVAILDAPITNYEDYDWYAPPMADLPSGFGLLICDGPPAGTRGGRYGVLPVMQTYLAPGCRVLLDDTHRKGERHVVARWCRQHHATCKPLGLLGSRTVIALGTA